MAPHLAPIPFWFAARLADDVTNMLRVQPSAMDLADYHEGLLCLADSVEVSLAAVRKSAATLVNDAVVG